MAFIDYYKILGVNKDIPQNEVRAAYRKRAKQFHPDLHPDDPKAKAKFQALVTLRNVVSMTSMENTGVKQVQQEQVLEERAITNGAHQIVLPLIILISLVSKGEEAFQVSFRTFSGIWEAVVGHADTRNQLKALLI